VRENPSIPGAVERTQKQIFSSGTWSKVSGFGSTHGLEVSN
jgi:hypothetical protein